MRYSNLYPGIDLVYYGNQQELEYDFIVQPGADPRCIELAFAGADQLELDSAGNLIVHTAQGNVIQQRPFIYQNVNGARQEIRGQYKLRGHKRLVHGKLSFPCIRLHHRSL